MAKSAIGSAEAITALCKELLLAMGTGECALMGFRLALVGSSLQVVLTKEGSGKIGWHVLGLGASYKPTITQTLKLRLASLWRNAAETFDSVFIVGDQQDHVSGFGPHGDTSAWN